MNPLLKEYLRELTGLFAIVSFIGALLVGGLVVSENNRLAALTHIARSN